MKHLCLNLKRFDVPVEMGGVNRLAAGNVWAEAIVSGTKEGLEQYRGKARFPMYFPEAHVIPAAMAAGEGSMIEVGCQSVYRADVAPGVNFGAYTTNRPAASMKALGVSSTIIGHCEERADKLGVLQEAGVTDTAAVNRLLNKEIKCAIAQGMTVTYCIGEKPKSGIIGRMSFPNSLKSDWMALIKKRSSSPMNRSGPSVRGRPLREPM